MRYVTIILLLTLAIIASCDSPADMNRTGDKLSGYITHTDSNLMQNGGYYSVSLFNADSINPFYRVPVRTDSLKLTKREIFYETIYDMDGIPSGRYFIASTWSKYPRVPNEIPIVLGTYGCDTVSNCTNHKVVDYPNYEGKFRNFFSWTDLGKRLY